MIMLSPFATSDKEDRRRHADFELISPLLSQSTAWHRPARQNLLRASPQAAGGFRVRPADTTTRR